MVAAALQNHERTGRDDDARQRDHDDGHKRPLEPGGILHAREQQAGQEHSRGAEEVRQAVGGAEDGDDDLGREAEVRSQGAKDRHRDGRQCGGRGDDHREAQVHQVAQRAEHERARAGKRGGGVVEDDDVEAGLAHEDRDGAGQADHEGDADHVAGAVEEAVDDLVLAQAAEHADDDGHDEEPHGGVVEVPLAERVAGEQAAPGHDGPGLGSLVVHTAGGEDGHAEVLPRNEAADHDHEGQAEQRQRDLALGRELERLGGGGVGILAVGLLGRLLLLQRQDGRALVAAHAVGVAQDEEQRDGVAHHGEDEAEADDDGLVGLDAHARQRVDGDAHGERVDRRAEAADARAEQHGRRGDHGVEARGEQRGGEQRVERDGLLAEAVAGAHDGEHGHDGGDEDRLVAVQRAHERGDARIEGTELVHDAQAAAEQQQEQRDLDAVEEAGDGRREDVGHRGRRDAGHDVRQGDRRHAHDERDDDEDGVRGDHDLLVGLFPLVRLERLRVRAGLVV